MGSPVDDALDRLGNGLRATAESLGMAVATQWFADLATVREALERLRRHPDAWSQEAFDQQKARAEAAEAEVRRLTLVAENRYERIGKAEAEVRRLTEGLRDLANEMNCRIEHGVGGVAALHLQYVENKLRALLSASPSDGTWENPGPEGLIEEHRPAPGFGPGRGWGEVSVYVLAGGKWWRMRPCGCCVEADGGGAK